MSIEELFKKGYIVLPSLISAESCYKLKAHLDSKFHTELSYNYLPGHYQIHLPNDSENIPYEILFQSKIHSIIKEVLGINYYLYSYTCNANQATKDQPYHMDCSHFHPLETIHKFGSPGPPIQLIVNTYLQDTNEENGSLEMIPGSHLITDFEIDEEGRIEDKYIFHTEKCNLPIGSVIIRDKRTWHRGTKNKSNKVRYMVGTSYTMNWYNLGKSKFKKNCEENLYDAPFSTWNLEYE
jgi:hypothetical protein